MFQVATARARLFGSDSRRSVSQTLRARGIARTTVYRHLSEARPAR